MKFLLIMLIIISNFFYFTSCTNSGSKNMEKTNNSFSIELEIISGKTFANDISDKPELDNTLLNKQIYVVGKVYRKGSGPSTYITLEIQCKQIKYLKKENIKVGWIPPNKMYPIYFLVYLGTNMEDYKVDDLIAEYKIQKIIEK